MTKKPSESQEGKIVVSSKTLGLISNGIYRSPASAIKELISNSFDADATSVRILMNPPGFDVVSITDDGFGMTFDKFVNVMKKQIGESDKRQSGSFSAVHHRALIGKIGIGLLAIAQICHEFEVTCHHRTSQTAFRARVVMTDAIQDELEHEYDRHEHDIGKYQIERIPFDERKCGTSIVASQVKRAFVTRMRETYDRNGALPARFDNFFKRAVETRSIRELSTYWKMAWGVAIASPLPYYDGGPIRQDQNDVNQIMSAAQASPFRVDLDQLTLKRPVVLPPRQVDQRSERDTLVMPLRFDEQIDGRQLAGQGYVYAQGGKSIYPAELRGILIRIKGVAIGDYDPNFLEYPFVEGPRIAWLSGELNISQGLEDALNIDRDSFNEAHPHFLEIQRLIHGTLDKIVRPWLYKNMDVRGKEKDDASAAIRQRELDTLTAKVLDKPATVERLPKKQLTGALEHTPVTVDSETGVIQINEGVSWPRSKSRRDLAERLAIGFELALAAPTIEETRRIYYDFLREALR